MPFGIVFVDLAIFLIPGGFVRSIAIGLIFRETAHANPNRFCLRLDLKRSLVRLYNSAHTRSYRDRTCVANEGLRSATTPWLFNSTVSSALSLGLSIRSRGH
jgi:hypothetical protein